MQLVALAGEKVPGGHASHALAFANSPAAQARGPPAESVGAAEAVPDAEAVRVKADPEEVALLVMD